MATKAVCADQFSWMNNEKSQSPCLVAAYVEGACSGPSILVPALKPNEHYTQPNETTKTKCFCSWAAYNLFSACAVCQGPQFSSSVITWDVFRQSCGELESTSNYFPPDFTLTSATSIPYWAANYPKQWTDAKFNVDQAMNLANQHKADLDPNRPPKHSKVGTIVGSVIGALALTAAIIAVAVYFISKKRKARLAPTALPMHGQSVEGRSFQSPPMTSRSTSDFTHKAVHSTASLGALGLAHGSNIVSPVPTPFSDMSHGQSQQPQVFHTLESLRPEVRTEDVIEPFITNSTSPPPMHSRKTSANATATTTQDEEGPSLVPPPAVRRLNPPAYSEFPEDARTPLSPLALEGVARPQHQRTKGSRDDSGSIASASNVGGPGITTVLQHQRRPSSSVIAAAGEPLPDEDTRPRIVSRDTKESGL